MNRIHYTKPSITDLEVGYATDAARNGWGPDCYNWSTRSHSTLASTMRSPHRVARALCTWGWPRWGSVKATR